jgi:hypothetical protein
MQRRIGEDTVCFLYNYEGGVLHGVFRRTGVAQINVGGDLMRFNARFPAQIAVAPVDRVVGVVVRMPNVRRETARNYLKAGLMCTTAVQMMTEPKVLPVGEADCVEE